MRKRKRKRHGNWLWKTGNRACHYCGEKLARSQLTIDHVKPLSAGGYDKRRNVVACCAPCNQLKGSLSREQFIAETAFVR